MSSIADLGLGSIPRATNWEYANTAARTGASGFVATDVGKLAKQLDTGAIWELTAVTPTWSQVGGGAGFAIDFTVNTQAGTAIVVDVSLEKDGTAVAEEYGLFAWLSDTPKSAIVSPAPTGGVVIGDGGAGETIIEHAADVAWHVRTNASGAIDFQIVDSGTPTFYLNLILPDGVIVVSDAITFV
jgi:hypothetical protein